MNFTLRWLAAIRRIDPPGAQPQPSRAREERRKIRRIDLRQIPEYIRQPPQSARDREVHPLPDRRLALRFGIVIAAVVEDLDQSNPRIVELLADGQRVVVTALVDLVPLERRAHEDWNHQLSVCTRDVRERNNRSGAGA